MRRDSTTSLAVLSSAESQKAVDLRGTLLLAALLAWVVAPAALQLWGTAFSRLAPPTSTAISTLLCLALAARLTRPILLPAALGGGPSGAAASAAAALEARLPRRLDAADGERELLRVGLASLRSLVPSCSGAALFTLPAFSEVTGAVASAEAFAPRLPHAARGALRDALRRVACVDPSTSVAFLCDAAPDAGSGAAWRAADSRDWPEGAATFSDWAAALGADDRGSSACFLTLAIAPSRGGPPLAAALLRFENRTLGRALNAAAALTGWRLLASSASAPPLARDAAPLLRFCGVMGDALAARRDKAAAAAALSHATALERDIFPAHLVPAVKARHSVAPTQATSGPAGGPRGSAAAMPLAPQDMLCEAHEDVTVIFCDVCRWTEIAGGMSAQEAMGVLDRLWQRLDTLSVAHGVYKVETIGDSYMAVSGMLPKRADHAAAALRFALDMHEAAAATELRPGGGGGHGDYDDEESECLSIRVGLHCGPVTSGIVGNLRPRFCLFGDTVNTASRMESSGRANCVQLSDAAFAATGLPPGLLVPRHYDVKGKGLMTTHVLEAGSAAALEVLEILSLDGVAAPDTRRSTEAGRGRLSHVAAARMSRGGGGLVGSPRTSLTRTRNSVATSGPWRSPRTSKCGPPAQEARSVPGSVYEGDDAGTGGARALRAALLCGAPIMAALAPDALRRLAGAALPSASPPLFAPLHGPLYSVVFATYAALLLLALANPAELPPALTTRLPQVAAAAHAAASALATPLLLARHVSMGDAACDAASYACTRAFLWRAHAPGAAIAWLTAAMPPFAVGFTAQLPLAGAYVACALACAIPGARGTVAAIGALAVAEAAAAHLVLVPLLLLMALDAPETADEASVPFVARDPCPAALRAWRERLRRWALRGRAACGWDDPRDAVLDSAAAGALVVAHAAAQLRLGTHDSLAATAALVLLTAAAARAARRRARARGGGDVISFDVGSPQKRMLGGELPYAVRRELDERERALALLRQQLTSAANEDAILRAGAAALALLFPDAAAHDGEDSAGEPAEAAEAGSAPRRPARANAFALGTFAEGSGVDVVASLVVACADERGRRALSSALPSGVGSWQPLTPSSVAFTCSPGARLPLLDSRDAPAGLRAFSDWAAAVDAGLRTRVAVTLPLCAGPVVVGFLQLHRPSGGSGGLEARVRDHGALRELADALGGSLFVRRAFALNRGGVPSRLPAASGRRSSVASADDTRRSSDSASRMARPVSVSFTAASEEEDEQAWEQLAERAAADRETLQDWALDPWALPDDEVQRLVVAMLDSLGLLRRFRMSPTAVARLVADVASHYNANPFHCFRHAFLVALAAWRFVVAGRLASSSPGAPPPLGHLDVLALLLSALCHDLEHPGTTNAFQVNTGSALAQRYNDASVLENHHCAVATAMLEASGVLATLSADDRKTLRKAMITAILATDMSVHKDLLVRVTAKVAAADEEAAARAQAAAEVGADGTFAEAPSAASELCFPTASADDRALLVAFLLHCADLHNPLLPPAMSQRIAGELSREFAAQAAQEQAAALPVTVMLGTTELARAQMEISFIDFVVQPLFTTLLTIVPALADLAERVEANRECWAKKVHTQTARRRSEGVELRRSLETFGH